MKFRNYRSLWLIGGVLVATTAAFAGANEVRRYPDLRMSKIASGSVYSKLGLKDGDVITAINGKPVSEPKDAARLLENLKTAQELSLTIKRAGQVKELKYDVKD